MYSVPVSLWEGLFHNREVALHSYPKCAIQKSYLRCRDLYKQSDRLPASPKELVLLWLMRLLIKPPVIRSSFVLVAKAGGYLGGSDWRFDIFSWHVKLQYAWK